MELSYEQLNEFNQDGFIVLKQFASHTLCDAILQKAQNHLALKLAPIESEQEYTQIQNENITVRRLRQVYNREPEFQAWMTHPNIRPILKQLLGEKPILTLAHHNSIMTKMPFESSRTFWHQDRRYWHFDNDELISVWLSLGDEVLNNGLLEFIPHSHTMSFEKEQFDKDANFLDEHPKNKALIQKKVHTLLEKGDVVLFHCKTLHHASKNTTKEPKLSFVYTVRSYNNQPLNNTRSDFKEVILD